MDIARQTHDIEIYRGDTIYESLTVLDSEDVAVDVSDCTYTAEIKRAVDGDVVLALEVDGTDAATGILIVSAPTPEAGIDLGTDGEGVWDLEIASNAATPIIRTSHRGSVTHVEDVTNSDWFRGSNDVHQDPV